MYDTLDIHHYFITVDIQKMLYSLDRDFPLGVFKKIHF